MATKTRIAVFGCGFWSSYQIGGWREYPDVEIVAVYNRTRSKAKTVADRFGISGVYDDPAKLIDEAAPDVIDIITDVDTHRPFVELAASRGRNVICQKPMAPTIRDAKAMVEFCRDRGVKYYIHENYRHQKQIRALAEVLRSGVIGEVFRARLDYITGYPVFRNQPFLRTLKQFILTDIGSHVLDQARFLFGDARSLYCQTHKVHQDIAGEDAASVMMKMDNATVLCNLAYAENYLEHDCFEQTQVFVEGTKGTVHLGPNLNLRVTTESGTHSRSIKTPQYPWANPEYAVSHASIVACNGDLLRGLREDGTPETTGEDNLKTMRLVYGAYASAKLGQVINPAADDWFDASVA